MKKYLSALLLLAAFSIASAQAAPTCVSGASGAAPTATLTSVLPTTNTDGSPVATPLTLSVYQGTTSGGEAKVQSGITTTTLTINTGLVDGATYYWEEQVTDAHGTNSSLSNEVCKQFPNGVPGTVTITVTDNKIMYEFTPIGHMLNDLGSPEYRLF